MYAKLIGVKIGNKTLITTKGWPSEPYLITISNNCQITSNVSFHTHGGGNPIRRQYPDFDYFGKIVVEDWAYIGSGLIILPGVTVGTESIIAAGSIVTRLVPPGEVWGGNPAKYICDVHGYIDCNLKNNLKCKKMSRSEKKRFLLSLDDSKFIKK
ncbi:MAG: acyltransferase [Bacteroidales bacterium]